MSDAALRALLFLTGGCGAVVIAVFEAALLRGRRRRRAEAASAAFAPEIHRALVEYQAGANDFDALRKLHKRHQPEFVAAFLTFRESVGGSARERMCELALQLGMLHDWREEARSRDPRRRRRAFTALTFVSSFEPCRRVTAMVLEEALSHSDRVVRLLAAQGLAWSGEPALLERILDMATRETPMGRILLAEALRPYAVDLCSAAVPAALRSGDESRMFGALELIAAWERALPVADFEALLSHPSTAIRDAARRAAPFVCVAGAA